MATITASGDYWTLDDDGLLDIFCAGNMPYGSSPPWYSYRSQVLDVVIRDGVTNIGRQAFLNCTNLESVTIPNNVTSIGNSAFKNCSSLEQITIPDGVNSIGSSAFYNCDGLFDITIPDGVSTINEQTFYGCDHLVSVTIPVSVTSIGDAALDNCPWLTDVYYGGTRTQWNAVTIGTDNNSLAAATIYCAPDPVMLESIAITTPPIQTVYIEGDSFDPAGMTVTASYSDGNTATVSGYSFAPSGALTVADTSIVVSYTENNITATANVAITVEPVTLERIAITTPPQKTAYTVGETFQPAGMTVTASYSDGNTATVSGYSFAPSGALTVADTSIVVSYTEDNITATANVAITVSEPVTLESIAITTPPQRTAYTVGETFKSAGMTVTAAYSDGNTATVSGYSFAPSGALTVADTSIVVSYTENNITATANVAITVSAPIPVPPNRIKIQITRTDGRSIVFRDKSVKKLDYVLSTSLDGNDVQTDRFTALLKDTSADWLSLWSPVNQACPVLLTVGDKTEKYYYLQLTRVGKHHFELTAQSPLGRLTGEFPGDLYDAAPLPDVLADIIGNVVPYTVNPLLESVKVYGWLPYQDRRTSLHQLSLAYGFLIRRNDNHDLYFTIPDTIAYDIPDNALYNGGSVTYRFGNTYARADITAYEFRENETEPKTLFDNVEGVTADNFIVKFDSPVFNLQADETLTVHFFGVNFAKISGFGRLTGKPYTKIASVVSVDGDPNADPQHILSVSDVPMITSLNAVAVGERLLSYYNAPAIVNTDIVHTHQKPGDCVAFVDPFGDPRTGYITELSGTASNIDRASATVVCGYQPTWGAAYDSVELLTGSGSWTVPASLDGATVRVVLIGGGTGGNSGQSGTGINAQYEELGIIMGCGRGLPGAGGNVLDIKFTAVAGKTYLYSAGIGGAGGRRTYHDITSERPETMTVYVTRTGERWHTNPHCNGGTYTPTTLKQAIARHLTACENCVKDGGLYYVSNPGQPGTASTFGVYSSANGQPKSGGFFDPLHGVLYAAPGPDNGVDGGSATTATENGDRTDPAYIDVVQHTVTLPWDVSQSWTSGAPGNVWHEHSVNPEYDDWAYGGLGGGAAVGSSGSNGQNGRFSAYVYGGRGGDGATADPIFPDIKYGSGGSGGHGGGEGGKGGSATAESGYQAENGEFGYGGVGSDGQNGADGCILIYYKKPNTLQYSFSVRDEQLILTYYTATPPPFSVNNHGQLVYTYADGETPPTFEIRDGILYKIE